MREYCIWYERGATKELHETSVWVEDDENPFMKLAENQAFGREAIVVRMDLWDHEINEPLIYRHVRFWKLLIFALIGARKVHRNRLR